MDYKNMGRLYFRLKFVYKKIFAQISATLCKKLQASLGSPVRDYSRKPDEIDHCSVFFQKIYNNAFFCIFFPYIL